MKVQQRKQKLADRDGTATATKQLGVTFSHIYVEMVTIYQCLPFYSEVCVGVYDSVCVFGGEMWEKERWHIYAIRLEVMVMKCGKHFHLNTTKQTE